MSSSNGAKPPTAPSRRVPHNDEAEQALLGAICLDNEVMADLASTIDRHDFYRPLHAAIYAVMLDLYDAQRAIDYITVAERYVELKRAADADRRTRDLYPAMGSGDLLDGLLQFLMEATERTSISANALHYAGLIKQASLLRRMAGVAAEIEGEAYSFTGDLPEWLDRCERRIQSVTQLQEQQEVRSPIVVVRSVFDRLERARDGAAPPSIATNLDRLDSMAGGGLRRGTLTVLAARPSMGKTSMGNTIVRSVALDRANPLPVLYFQSENSAEDTTVNLLSAGTGIAATRIHAGLIQDHEIDQLAAEARRIAASRIFIDDTPSISLREIQSKSRRAVSKAGVSLIVIDYLQLLARPQGLPRGANREQEVSTLSRGLKALARDLDVPVLLLAQLNRDVEKRAGQSGNTKPRMSDLRESGAIEQDADLIWLLHRPHYYTQHEEDRNKAEIIQAKCRNGPTGSIPLRFDGPTLSFSSAPDDDFPAPPPEFKRPHNDTPDSPPPNWQDSAEDRFDDYHDPRF